MVDGEVCRKRISAHDAARRTRIASKPHARDPTTVHCALGTSGLMSLTTQGQATNAIGEVDDAMEIKVERADKARRES
jgi:hypothetical protein